MFEMLGPILGGMGQLAGGISQLTRQGSSTPDNSTFYQNWRNDDMAWSREQFQRNEDLQREFARNGIKWRVADAREAGLHPLAAIGAAGSTYSPTVTAGGGNYQVDSGRSSGGPDIGSSLANMGQGLGRAISATQTPAERVETATQMIQGQQQTEMNDKRLKMMDIDLLMKASQYALMTTGNGPGMPPNSNLGPKSQPDPTAGHTETTENMGTRYRDPYGGQTSLPQKDINIDEVSSPGWSAFMYTNRILPLIHQITGQEQPSKPDLKNLPPGAVDWHFAFPGRWIPKYASAPRPSRGHLSPSEPYSYHGSY